MSKRKRPGIKPTIISAPVDQEDLLQQLQKEDTKPSTVVDPPKPQRKIRFTMDLPENLHTEITNRADDNGQTIKGYILKLVKADLKQYNAV